MIHPESRTLTWITDVAKANKMNDLMLAEKTIRAFSLLEALVRSGCPFIFKGGSSLMLHLDASKRLSIDIDIICQPGTCIEDYIGKYAEEYGFGEVKLVERVAISDVPKQHAKFFYQVAYPAGGKQDKILLDVLFEDTHYTDIVELPIQSRLLKTYGEKVMVKVPSKGDLLGDKLTAFAPHTSGIPYFYGEMNCSMEICKQLFDIASLFDVTSDLSTTIATFRRFAKLELQYINRNPDDYQIVLDDIYNTAQCIALHGKISPEEFKLLQEGVSKVRGFIHSEVYTIERAITDAAKAAYLAKLIEKGITEVKHFTLANIPQLAAATIQAPLPTKLNKLKKSNIEAFYYWHEIQLLNNAHTNVQ